MESRIELHIEGQWRPAAELVVEADRVRFDYLPEYVFGDVPPQPVSALLPPALGEVHCAPGDLRTRLAFLWDLVPQGRGRRHLCALLGISPEGDRHDLFLAQHGAFAPIGRVRLDTAVRFYHQHTEGRQPTGFTERDMLERTDVFLDQLELHGMLSAGTPGVQGVAPKFLLTQDHDGLWFPDVALPDERAARHWILKRARGARADDERLLRHEGLYLQALADCGLRSMQPPRYRDGMLFLPRFDREVRHGQVVRIHQESLASLVGAAGFARSVSLFDVTAAIAARATDPGREVAEFVCRDLVNRVLGNADNHLRNTSMQRLDDGTWRLSPLYDVAPMYLDHDDITRTCHWISAEGRRIDGWEQIVAALPAPDAVRADVSRALIAQRERHLPRLIERLVDLGADGDVVQRARASADQQIDALQAIRA